MSRYALEYERAAVKDLRAITDRKLLLRLKTAIEALAEVPRPDGCRKMAGFDDLWRVRVGDWRIVYRIEDGRLVIVVVTVAVRGGVYR